MGAWDNIIFRRVYDPPHRLWEATNGEQLKRFLGERIGVMGAVSFLPDGETLAAVAEDGRLFSWNMTTGRELRRSKLDRLDRVGVVAFAQTPRPSRQLGRMALLAGFGGR